MYNDLRLVAQPLVTMLRGKDITKLKMPDTYHRPRVLHVIPYLSTGGRERALLLLLKHLNKELFEIAAVCFFPPNHTTLERDAVEAGIQIHYLSKKLGIDLSLFAQLNRVYRSFQPDIVHTHLSTVHYTLPITLLNKCKGRFHTFGDPLHGLRHASWDRFIYLIAFRYYGHVPISLSKDIESVIQSLYGPIYSPVIPNGTDLTIFSPKPEQGQTWRQQAGIPEKAFVFTNIARFHPIKNQQLLVDAFAQVVNQVPHSRLLFVGGGPLKKEIQEKVVVAGLAPYVQFLGERSDVDVILQASDVVVSASISEGLPNNLVEAMAAAKPVIATAVGGVPEVVTHGITGFLISSQDQNGFAKAMLTLEANRELAKWMGIQGHQIAQQQFDVRVMARKHEELYMLLLQESAQSKHTDKRFASHQDIDRQNYTARHS